MSVQQKIEEIKQYMPETYKLIQDKAGQIGNEAYRLVRRGLSGHPNCFYAIERGRVVGTPFNLVEIQRDIAHAMVAFGCAHVCVFALIQKEQDNGAH